MNNASIWMRDKFVWETKKFISVGLEKCLNRLGVLRANIRLKLEINGKGLQMEL